MIVSFADEATADLYHGRNTSRVRRFPHDILHRALVRLDVLNTAQHLMDLSSPPGNRLEALSGDWSGFHSIRINKQWRIVFRWEDGNVYDVQVVDYH
ncbi:MAG: type II toxin-antitoxin system RelE/ParE family toxin [Caldilineaceae bacterium]|nr:type II toxin-antitoxin system RelE/ParE family toxin [Caldilineaceae bacterium]